MITITGLTHRQKTIMDLLWTCSTLEQARDLIVALPTVQDRMDAQGLIKIATWESIEQELGLEEYADAANTAISRAMQ